MGAITKYVIPITVSLALHGLVFGFLVVGWESQPTPKRIVPPNYIKAELVQLESKSKKKASARKKPKKIDLTAQRRAQEQKKRAAEKQRQEKLQREKAARNKAEKEAKEKLAREKAQRLEAQKKAQELQLQQEFEDALREEQGMLLEEEYANEAQSYVSKFQQRIQSNWSRPPSARTGMQCLLKIQLVPTGRIVNVNIAKSSGNGAFDRSAVQAVKKVETFPEVKEMTPEVFERYFRTFNLSFDPQDLRL